MTRFRVPRRVLLGVLPALLCSVPRAFAAGQQAASTEAQHGGQTAGLALLALLEAFLIAALLVDRRRRRRVQLSLAVRVRFESLVAELSARLIPVSPRDVDREIEAGLGRVVDFLGMDRASLDEQVGAGAVVRISAGVERTRPMPVIEPGRFPWTAGQLQRGQVVQFSRLDELPAEAALDRESYRDMGTRSYVALPLSDGGSMLGAVSFDSVHAERAWSDELTKRLPVLGEVFAGALGRKRLELSLAERLRFETLLSEQAAKFSSLPLSEVDHEIERALRRIADFFQADWGNLAEFSQGSPVARITHSWVAEGVAPTPETVSLADIPWIMSRWERGEVVRFSRVEELPEREAGVDRLTQGRLGITSQVSVPLKVGGAVLGALTFSTLGTARVWPDELVQRLLLLGEVFASMLSRRHAELQAQQLRQDLSHVGRVSTMGELTTSLAHELNQPLTAILSNAQAAQRMLGADPVNLEKIREILTAIVADDRRAAEVIGRLRGLLKRGKLERTALDANEVVGEVARLVRSDAELRGVPVRLELDPDLPKVRGDRVQLQQVALNLILNALDAMRAPSGRHRTLVLRTHRDGGAVRVAVRDAGPGIDPGEMEHIFDAFYTTKPEGLGMGLAIARSIVEEHGGRLDARNNPEGGATFSFTVPVWTDGP